MAVALWAMDIPGLGKALPPKPEPAPIAEEQAPANVKTVALDKDSGLAIQDRLDLAVKRPTKLVEAPTTEVKPPPAEPAHPETPAWKYLGQLKEAGRTLALVSLDGAQRFVAKGAMVRTSSDNVYQATLKTITPSYIEFEDGKRKILHVDKEAPTSRVSWVKPVTVTPGAPSMPQAGLSAEARQRLVAGQIDPAQVEKARAAAAQALAGRNRAVPNANGVAGQGLQNPANPGIPTSTTYPGGTIVAPPGSSGTDKSNDGSDQTKKPVNTAKGVKAKAVD
jgi:hypothetical protein